MKNVFLFLFTFSLGTTFSAAQAAEFGDIVSSCTDLALDRASISAVCEAENGGRYKTTLRLRGVNNHDGVLTFDQDSSTVSVFNTTCTNGSVDGRGVLAALCKADNGRSYWSTLDLRPLLKNYNGTLVYPLEG